MDPIIKQAARDRAEAIFGIRLIATSTTLTAVAFAFLAGMAGIWLSAAFALFAAGLGGVAGAALMALRDIRLGLPRTGLEEGFDKYNMLVETGRTSYEPRQPGNLPRKEAEWRHPVADVICDPKPRTADDLRYNLDPVKALEECQEIAREVTALIAINATPNFTEVDRLCWLLLDFTGVTVRDHGSPKVKIQIETAMGLDDEGVLSYYAKGHHATGDFLAAVLLATRDDLTLVPSRVTQTYWRNCPAPGDQIVADRQFIESEKAPGAFAVTVYQVRD